MGSFHLYPEMIAGRIREQLHTITGLKILKANTAIYSLQQLMPHHCITHLGVDHSNGFDGPLYQPWVQTILPHPALTTVIRAVNSSCPVKTIRIKRTEITRLGIYKIYGRCINRIRYPSYSLPGITVVYRFKEFCLLVDHKTSGAILGKVQPNAVQQIMICRILELLRPVYSPIRGFINTFFDQSKTGTGILKIHFLNGTYRVCYGIAGKAGATIRGFNYYSLAPEKAGLIINKMSCSQFISKTVSDQRIPTLTSVRGFENRAFELAECRTSTGITYHG